MTYIGIFIIPKYIRLHLHATEYTSKFSASRLLIIM